MLRRFFSGPETTSSSAPDNLVAVEKLLSLESARERGEYVLKHLADSLDGDIQGMVVRVTGDTTNFEAVHGYPASLSELHPEHGPWRDSRPRIITNLIAELFTPNPKEMREQLGDTGLREVRSCISVPLRNTEQSYGAMLITRHSSEAFTEQELKYVTRWGNILGSILSTQAELLRTRQSLVEFTRAFIEAMEAQDFSQLGHATRVTSYTMAMGRSLGFNRTQLADLYYAAMLHDVGKLGQSDLTIEDHQHPSRGANLIASAALLQEAQAGIRHHHENWDGTGFPDGLRRKDIPLLARLIAVADTFDLLSSERGQALPVHEVEKELERRSNHELDPELVTLFVNILRKGKSTAELSRLDKDALPF